MADHDAELERFLAGKQPVDLGKTLRTLPRTANVELAVEAVLRLVDHPHWLAASCSRLPVAVIRGVLAAEVPGNGHLFLRLAVPREAKAAQLKAAWHTAVGVLRELTDTTHAWGSEPRRALLARLATDPIVLAALQGLVAHARDVSIEMLAVLAIDGSDASIDALIPHLDPALGERDARLERLALLRDCARPTQALDALFAEVGSALVEFRRTSPALALGPRIGLETSEILWFRLRLASEERVPGVIPRVQGNVRVDSREAPWFEVWVSTDRETRFDDTRVVVDELGIGACKAADLPAWLAQLATQLKIEWQPFFVHASADAKRITRWLTASPRA